jgi:hypothetical protein
MLVESGTIFLAESKQEASFVTATQGISVLRLIANPKCWMNAEGFVCAQARKLLLGLNNSSAQISAWWERMVDLTIISHAASGISLREVFHFKNNFVGIDESCPRLEVVHEPKDWRELSWVEPFNTLVIPNSKSQSGFYSRVTVSITEATFGVYVQPKIHSPDDVDRAYTNAIIYSLVDGLSRGRQVSEVHIVVYNWGLADDSSHSTAQPDHVKARVQELVKDSVLTEVEACFIKKFMKRFLSTNFHVVSREEMKQWLIPSFISIPEAILAFE